MVRNDALINGIRSQKFTFKGQTARVVLYKKKGGTQRIAIHRREYHDPDYVKRVLSEAGMEPDEIERFISETSRNRKPH